MIPGCSVVQGGGNVDDGGTRGAPQVQEGCSTGIEGPEGVDVHHCFEPVGGELLGGGQEVAGGAVD